jgi:peptidoglycan hydrolase CwlO-like protein
MKSGDPGGWVTREEYRQVELAHAEKVQAMQGEIDRLKYELAFVQGQIDKAQKQAEQNIGTIAALHQVIDKLINGIAATAGGYER